MDQKLEADIHLIKALTDLEEELNLFIDAQQGSQQANEREADEVTVTKASLQTKEVSKENQTPEANSQKPAPVTPLEPELESEKPAPTPAPISVPEAPPTPEPGRDPDDFVS